MPAARCTSVDRATVTPPAVSRRDRVSCAVMENPGDFVFPGERSADVDRGDRPRCGTQFRLLDPRRMADREPTLADPFGAASPRRSTSAKRAHRQRRPHDRRRRIDVDGVLVLHCSLPPFVGGEDLLRHHHPPGVDDEFGHLGRGRSRQGEPRPSCSACRPAWAA